MGNPSEVPPLPHSKKLKILTTLAVLYGNITLGCAFNFFSPALEDIRNKYDTNVEDVSKVFTIILVAYCFGALTSGIYYNFVNRQLVVITCLGGMAIVICVTPHLATKTLFFVFGGFLGYCCGAYDTANIVWLIEMWQSKCGPFIQAQHAFYALGTNIPSLLLGPFLTKDTEDDEVVGNTNSTSTTLSTATEESRIYIPFTIAAGLSALACGFQGFLFIFYRYYTPPLEEVVASETDTNDGEKESIPTSNSISISRGSIKSSKEDAIPTVENLADSKDVDESRAEDKPKINWPKVKLITLSAMFFAAYQGMEMCTIQFIPTFAQYSDLKLSESESAYVLTGLTATFATGRCLGIFIVLKAQPQFIIMVNLALIILGNSILLIWASSSLTMLWAGCIILGAGFSTTYPSYCAYVEKHMVFGNGFASLIVVTGTATAAIYPLIVGTAIENNAVVLTYVNFFSIFICILTLSLSSKLTYGNKKKFG